jgi:hypothetical protein
MFAQVSITPLTSAALGYPLAQGPRFYFPLLPAQSTAAQPKRSSSALVHASMAKYFPIAKALSAKIYQPLFAHHPILR